MSSYPKLPPADLSTVGSSRQAEIQERLLAWYATHKRDLPWRDETDPYRILVSEVMLQQTGVERVRPAYANFIEKFPTFQALAAASRHEVLLAWAGMGYNRRAVYLHECARAVARDFGGELPRDPEVLRRLPGIGPYTLGALLSFAFHQDVAAIDTNLRRVISRIEFGVGGSDADLARVAQSWIPPGESSTWNQALMDFGSLQCTANKPLCFLCPLASLCRAAPVEPAARSRRKVAEAREPFVGSRRYLRGRIVARLRELGPSTLVPVETIAQSAWDGISVVDLSLGVELCRALAAEGLARVAETPSGLMVGPPN